MQQFGDSYNKRSLPIPIHCFGFIMEVLRRNLLLTLLLVSSSLIGICSSCGVEDEALIEYRRHQFDRQLLEQNRRPLNETIDANGSTQEPTSAPTEGPSNPKLLFHGSVLNENREPLVDAQVQFWHADWHGNYLHPGDNLNGFDLMTDTFSYFGTATTGSNGTFDFITYRPGIYRQRPVTHIHFKVFVNGTEVLTSQFYWEDEGISRWKDEMLVLSFNQTVDEDGNAAVFTEKEIVVNTKGRGYSGSANLTPSKFDSPGLVRSFPIFSYALSHRWQKVNKRARSIRWMIFFKSAAT